MFRLTKDCCCILPGFLLSVAAWIVSTLSMVFKSWRVWHMKGPLLSSSRVAYVGMWEVCIYHLDSNGSNLEQCHVYKHHVPLDILICHYALIICTIVGMLSLFTTILILAKRKSNKAKKNFKGNPFDLPGYMNIVTTVSVSVAVIINFHAVQKMKGIDFPPSFNLPFKPDTQNSGIALLLAGIGCFLYFLTVCIYFIIPKDNRVYPEN